MIGNRSQGLLVAGLVLFVGVTCTEIGPTDPRATRFGRVALMPSLSEAASKVYPRLVVFGLELDNIRLRLTRARPFVLSRGILDEFPPGCPLSICFPP